MFSFLLNIFLDLLMKLCLDLQETPDQLVVQGQPGKLARRVRQDPQGQRGTRDPRAQLEGPGPLGPRDQLVLQALQVTK